MQVIAFFYHLGNLGVFLRHFIGHIHLIFHIVVVLLPSAKLFYMLGIIRIIIYCSLSAELVKSPGKHTFGVHIGKAQRTYHLLHTMLPAPLFHGIKQCTRDIDIIDEINPSEADTALFPTLVCLLVDDGSHTSSHLTILIGKEILRLTEVKGGILVL